MANHFKYPHCENIIINEVNVAYRKEVVHYLDLVRTTYTGRRLCEFILRRKPLFVVITPVRPSKDHSVNNAYSIASSTEDAYMKDYPVMDKLEWKALDLKLMVPVLPLTFGTGNGSNSLVEYHPATWRQMMKNKHRLDPGAGPGEILFHELVHSMRELNGKFVNQGVAENSDMDDFEEFCAVLAANLYRQERGFKVLRESHLGYTAVPGPRRFTMSWPLKDGKRQTVTEIITPDPDLMDPKQYYQFYKAQIKKWFDTQQDFCVAMARSAVDHNPLAIAADDLGISVLDG